MAIPRRRFLCLLANLSAAGRHVDGSEGSQAAGESARAQVDPQIQRLRAIAIDEQVEPALIFVPDLEP
jgi:hypothetical protein